MQGQVTIDLCDLDNSPLRIRTGRLNNYFVGCSNFPQCKNCYFFDSIIAFAGRSDQSCPFCQENMVEVKHNISDNHGNLYCSKRNCNQSIFSILKRPNTDHDGSQQPNYRHGNRQRRSNGNHTQSNFSGLNQSFGEQSMRMGDPGNNMLYQGSSGAFLTQRGRLMVDDSIRDNDSRLQNYNSNEGNHFASSSINQRQERSNICFNCGREGHFARDCTSENRSRYNQTKTTPKKAKRGYIKKRREFPK